MHVREGGERDSQEDLGCEAASLLQRAQLSLSKRQTFVCVSSKALISFLLRSVWIVSESARASFRITSPCPACLGALSGQLGSRQSQCFCRQLQASKSPGLPEIGIHLFLLSFLCFLLSWMFNQSPHARLEVVSEVCRTG